ncbi:hypothetical protein Aple_075510 [Acrocarpospora pleiomorpha]|uniref:Uncharacterized protein n=1 Tax=Acrocarpospora pleiomorpha TaxID=90975 RepID=A0A5M3XUH7_9ACTN|nr:hypothetical protein [Acrocarpospora pleiomorpha]GES24652.1 hypothetical protein Aple_075510 [Acrocarpospora pleiomorpha]
MTYRPHLSERALSQLGGFPTDALTALVKAMADVCENPYDPLTSMATDDPQVRRADFGDHGFVTFLILDSVEIVRVVDILWAG